MQLEYDVGEWLLANSTVIQYEMSKLHNKLYHHFPDVVYDLYLENYEKKIISLIRKECGYTFSLNPEQINGIINRQFIIKMLGEKFLSPPNEENVNV